MCIFNGFPKLALFKNFFYPFENNFRILLFVCVNSMWSQIFFWEICLLCKSFWFQTLIEEQSSLLSNLKFNCFFLGFFEFITLLFFFFWSKLSWKFQSVFQKAHLLQFSSLQFQVLIGNHCVHHVGHQGILNYLLFKILKKWLTSKKKTFYFFLDKSMLFLKYNNINKKDKINRNLK